MRIADYALLGDTQTAALVGRDGSIDWLCAPRFDSPACFAALLGAPRHGRWQLAPTGALTAVTRRYRPESLVLETELHTRDGAIRIVDCMAIRDRTERPPVIVRMVEGVSGRVPVHLELALRGDYGRATASVQRADGQAIAVVGATATVLTTPAPLAVAGSDVVADFVVSAGDQVPFTLAWLGADEPAPPPGDPAAILAETHAWWQRWAARCTVRGPERAAVVRSLVALQALIYAPTGGVVAAPTTSLPEVRGGSRNWDYRYCWLRDSAFTIAALAHSGYERESIAWQRWLIRAVGDAAPRVLYTVTGERPPEGDTIDELPGFAGSRPVRRGNDAQDQLQLDIYGELADAFHEGRRAGLPVSDELWALERALVERLERLWRHADRGIWENRGAPRHYTYSKVMAWVAFDRAIRAIEDHGLPGPLARWRETRDAIHRDVCEHGYDPALAAFTQSYGSPVIDAAVLRIATVGFLPATDPRVAGTIAAVERALVRDGFVARYATQPGRNDDGQVGREGTFLACSCWLADAYAVSGRDPDARAQLDRVLAVANDVGLLAEEYDPAAGELLGNFPQALTHLAVVRTLRLLADRR